MTRKLVREPGLPFHQNYGETKIAVAGEHTAEALYDLNRRVDQPRTLKNISDDLPKECKDLVAINVSELFRKIYGCIDIDDRDVQSAAYPESAE